jgi:acetoacetyl-CoA synthetase
MGVRGQVLWSPTPDSMASAPLANFARWLAGERGNVLTSYSEIWQWSTEDLEGFWSAIWRYHDVGTRPPEVVLGDRTMPGCEWFRGATLNYAEEMLRRAPASAPAVLTLSEDGRIREISREELEHRAGALAATLLALGIESGDRVAALLPNTSEALVGLLACAAIGAIWTSCSPDFGFQSVAERFAQVRPRVLLACDGYRFGGGRYDRRDEVRRLRDALPSLRATILVPRLDPDAHLEGAIAWADAVADAQPLRCEPVDFDHPLWILFSSGTTGTPKGIVQGHGGIVLEHLKALGLGAGLDAGDRFYFFSSTSWMVWNWLVSGLLVGATPVLYDGSPGHPDGLGSWRVAARTGAAVFGTGAAYLSASEKARLEPARDLDLSALRTVISTGSPLPVSTWYWLSSAFEGRVRLDSSSGGTDVCSVLIGGSPWLPVHAGELAAPSLGVMAQAFSELGQPVVGAVGELVISEPMPSMPLSFWNDPDGSRYREAYFSRFPGHWCHGDWVEFTERGTAVISGRSDATLNKAGVRMGSADIYAVVDVLPGVQDSLVIGLELPDGEYYMPLFVVIEDGHEIEDLAKHIRAAIRRDISPRHLPDDIIEVPAVPRTRTGKKLEVPIKRILLGSDSPEDIASGAVIDSAALEWYARFGRERVAPLAAGNAASIESESRSTT